MKTEEVLSNINHAEIDILNLPKERKTDRDIGVIIQIKMIDAVVDFP